MPDRGELFRTAASQLSMDYRESSGWSETQEREAALNRFSIADMARVVPSWSFGETVPFWVTGSYALLRMGSRSRISALAADTEAKGSEAIHRWRRQQLRNRFQSGTIARFC